MAHPPGYYAIPPNLPILIDETVARFGYSPIRVSPTSPKKVIVQCVRCKAIFDRQRQRVVAPVICRSCAHAKTELPAHDTVDAQATFEQFGYQPQDLKTYDLRKVIAVCQCCQKKYQVRRINVPANGHCFSCTKRQHWLTQTVFCEKCNRQFVPRTLTKICAPCRQTYEQKPVVTCDCTTCGKQFTRRAPSARCPDCLKKHTWSTKRGSQELNSDLGISIEETIRQYQIDPRTLTERSHQKVVVLCIRCKQLFSRRRRAIVPDPLCMSCSYQDRNHEQAKARRIQTCLDRYGTPVPPVPPTSYGKTENVISGWLREINFEPKAQHQLSNGKSLDIVLPNEKLAIEYCGLYWHHEHSPTPRLRLYHYDKMRLAQEEGWQLITVFEDEWKLHENGVKSLILARLEKPQRRLFARECQIEALSSEVTKTFLDQFHIQGPPHAFLFSTGIYQNQQLLGVLTLSEHHRQNYATTLVLSRMAFLPSVQIVGGAGRLLKHALRMLGSTTHTRLVSWSDNRYSNGDVYRALGFSLQAELPPDYQYVIIQKPRERISKQSQRKTKSKCPAGMTELQWAEQRGLARIWDCGKKRWELTLPIP